MFLTGCAEDLGNEGDSNNNAIPNIDSDSTFSVITWNVEWFPKHIHTVNSMAEIIVNLNADIFALQEITSSSSFNQLIDSHSNLNSDSFNCYFL